jgi:hypothetical protein
LEEQADGMSAMSKAGADVLLLTARRDLDTGAAQNLNVADDSAQATVEQAVAEIFVGEESALLTGLGSKAEEAGAAQGDDAAAGADLEIVLGSVEGQPHRDLLAIVEGFASGFVGGDDEQLDLAEPELAVDLLGIERKDFFGSLQDGTGDEGGTVGAGFNAATEEVVEGLGIGALATHLVFDAAGTDHGRHLQGKPMNGSVTYGIPVYPVDARWHKTE